MHVHLIGDVDRDRPATSAGRYYGRAGGGEPVEWQIASEAAIAFVVNGEEFAVMMATPEDLVDFAVGFLVSERIIRRADDIVELRLLPIEHGYAINCVLEDRLARRAKGRARRLVGQSGCGLCGAETIAHALPQLPSVRGQLPRPAAVMEAMDRFGGLQPMNARNRSTHGAAFFALADNTPIAVREDVGRHNALDKVGGALLRSGVDPREGFLVISSRMSVEMVQKAIIFGEPLLVSLSAPTDLALATAQRYGLAVAARAGEGVVYFWPS